VLLFDLADRIGRNFRLSTECFAFFRVGAPRSLDSNSRLYDRNFLIHKLFERSCELGLWRLTAHEISEIFGPEQKKLSMSVGMQDLARAHEELNACWAAGDLIAAPYRPHPQSSSIVFHAATAGKMVA
jgi:hypothetical protein